LPSAEHLSTRTVAIRLLRDRTVRRKVPRQSVGIDFASVDRSRRGVMT